jgi:very-short-patch-repair endonuclease
MRPRCGGIELQNPGGFHVSVREHVASGKWIVDFFFPEIRLAIEVDGSTHNSQAQQAKDRQKDADCKRFDITVLRLRNAEIFGNRDRLTEKLRWRRGKVLESSAWLPLDSMNTMF